MVKTVFISASLELTHDEANLGLHETLDMLSIKLTGAPDRLIYDENFSFAPHPSQPGTYIVAGNTLEVSGDVH